MMKSQGWICPVCNQNFINGETLQLHHIQGRKFKNANSFSNLLILHEECHKKVHYSRHKEDWVNMLMEFKRMHPCLKDCEF